MVPQGSITRVIDISVVVERLGKFLISEEKVAKQLPTGHDDRSGLNTGHYGTSELGHTAVVVAGDASFLWMPSYNETDEEHHNRSNQTRA